MFFYFNLNFVYLQIGEADIMRHKIRYIKYI